MLEVNLIRKFFGRRCFQFFAAITGKKIINLFGIILIQIFIGSLGILSSEMHFGWSSPSLPILINGTYIIKLSSEEASWLAVTIFPGNLIGALISMYFSTNFGRKNLILTSSLPLLASWLILALARYKILLFFARFLGGISEGLNLATVPMYLGEIAEPNIRGYLSSFCPIFVVMGILLVNIFGIFFTIDQSAFLACLIPIFMFFTFIWMPESPVLLLQKGFYAKAKENLVFLRGEEEGIREFLRLTIKDAEKSEECLQENKFKHLFRIPVNRKALLIALSLRCVQQLCGSTVLTFYCMTIFQETEGFLSANISTIIYFSLQAIFAILSSFLVDFFGRRPMFILSLFGTTLTLFIVGIYLFLKAHYYLDDLSAYNWIPVSSLLLNISFFSLGVRNIPLLVISEIFHSNIKSKALCFITIFYAIFAIIVTQFFNFTKEFFEMSYPIFTFAFFSIISLILYYFYVPETRGKTLEDIQEILTKNKIY